MSLDFYLYHKADLGGSSPCTMDIFDINATHNLVPMWEKAGCYKALYKSNGKLAKSILPALLKAHRSMVMNANDYRALNPSNGWGSYDGAIMFLLQVIKACEANPLATISISA